MKVNLTTNIGTIYWKYLVPISLIASTFFLTMYSWVKENTSFLKIIPFSIYCFYQAYKIKFVSADNENLYVKDFRKSVIIPLSEIKDAKQSNFGLLNIKIRLKNETEFGKTIVFMPYFEFLFFGAKHSVLKELESYINLQD